MNQAKAPLTLLASLALMLTVAACVNIFQKVKVEEVPRPETELAIRTPLKAHLTNGHVVVFAEGVDYSSVSRNLVGQGIRYDLNLSANSVRSVPLDSVAAMETFDRHVQVLPTLLVTAGATAAGVFATAAAAVAIFGSCPTVYADGHLEAETFSNSVSRLMEVRDVDRLEARPDATGQLRLEFRNEALETHYINHLELLSVTHFDGEVAVPQRDGTALLMSGLSQPFARDRSGRVVTDVLASSDKSVYRSDDKILASPRADDLKDFIDLVVPRPATDSAAVMIRGRSSLLTTVLLYDFMLSQGPPTLDYAGVDLESIGEAMALGALFREHLGIRVSVYEDGDWVTAGRIGTSGPVAWETLGIKIPVPADDSLRVRLEFLADSWRFDHIVIAERVRSPSVSRIPLSAVEGYSAELNATAMERLSGADTEYHLTFPGQSFAAVFDASGNENANFDTTYFLAAQGYYTEWIRRAWFDREPTRFAADANTLARVVGRWRESRSWYEANFFTARIPVETRP